MGHGTADADNAQPKPPEGMTAILAAVDAGDETAAERLLPLVYDELRALARHRMALEPAGHTLQATALVHEAYLRLLGDQPVQWANKAHFFAAAARAMRRILIERARRQKAARHGGGARRITLFEGAATEQGSEAVDLIALDDALEKLEKQDRQAADLVSLRYFAGLTIEETAQAMGLSPATVKREWNYAKAWLYAEIGGKS